MMVISELLGDMREQGQQFRADHRRLNQHHDFTLDLDAARV